MKKVHETLLATLSNIFFKISLADSAINLIYLLTTPLHLKYVATLPCETLMSAKQALNDKLQYSVAAYLTCGGVVNNEIKKGLLLNV